MMETTNPTHLQSVSEALGDFLFGVLFSGLCFGGSALLTWLALSYFQSRSHSAPPHTLPSAFKDEQSTKASKAVLFSRSTRMARLVLFLLALAVCVYVCSALYIQRRARADYGLIAVGLGLLGSATSTACKADLPLPPQYQAVPCMVALGVDLMAGVVSAPKGLFFIDTSNSSEPPTALSALGQFLFGVIFMTLCMGIGVAAVWLALACFYAGRTSASSYMPLATSVEEETSQTSERQQDVV